MQRSDRSFFPFFFLYILSYFCSESKPKVAPLAPSRWRNKKVHRSPPLTAGVLPEHCGGNRTQQKQCIPTRDCRLPRREQTEKHCITPKLTFPISFPTPRQPCHVSGSPARHTPQGIISESPTSAGYQRAGHSRCCLCTAEHRSRG